MPRIKIKNKEPHSRGDRGDSGIGIVVLRRLRT